MGSKACRLLSIMGLLCRGLLVPPGAVVVPASVALDWMQRHAMHKGPSGQDLLTGKTAAVCHPLNEPQPIVQFFTPEC